MEDVGLIEVLEPIVFENHRDLINAMFEVYYDISTEYMNEFYYTGDYKRDLVVSLEEAGPRADLDINERVK